MQKIVTMQDISCIGKCSLTAVLPVLSAMGIEAVPLPTAVLSAHTMFHDVSFCDLTDQIEPIMNHWEKENFRFDGVYTGYLGSFEQIRFAQELFNRFGKDAVRVVDPCMADHGKLYTGFDEAFAQKMRELCSMADVICPNITEACYLLDISYREDFSETQIRDILRRLCETGCTTAVITGTSLHEGKIGAYAYNRKEDRFSMHETEKEAQSFHGTGDIWAAVFTGCLVLGRPFEQALSIACEFVREAIHQTLLEENHNVYGTNFEWALPYLIAMLKAR
ncbi:MAG: pyridoxamine kinase [Bulleidia sp.]